MDVRQRGTNGVAAGVASSHPRPIRRTISDKSRGSGTTVASTCMIGVCLAITVSLIIVGTVDFFSKSDTSAESSSASIRGLKDEGDDNGKLLKSLQEEKRSLRQQLATLKKQLSDADKAAKLPSTPADNTELTKQLTRLRTYKTRMHEMIQYISKRNLLYKYGSGPHFVEIVLSIDPASNIADSSKTPDTETLMIEMAPVDEMPATVFWFLEQVNTTLFDGCSFHRNAHHVVQGGPAFNFETPAGAAPMRRFRETGLEDVPFQE
jgi:hypothetical protein